MFTPGRGYNIGHAYMHCSKHNGIDLCVYVCTCSCTYNHVCSCVVMLIHINRNVLEIPHVYILMYMLVGKHSLLYPMPKVLYYIHLPAASQVLIVLIATYIRGAIWGFPCAAGGDKAQGMHILYCTKFRGWSSFHRSNSRIPDSHACPRIRNLFAERNF